MSKPAPTGDLANVPEPAKAAPTAQPKTEAVAPPADNQPDAAAAQKQQPAKPAQVPSQAEERPKPPTMEAQPRTEASAPPAASQADAQAVQTPEPAKPIVPPQTKEPPKAIRNRHAAAARKGIAGNPAGYGGQRQSEAGSDA